MYLKYFFSQPPWMVCQSIMGLPPSIKLSVTHLYTWVESAYCGDIEKVILKNTTGTKILNQESCALAMMLAHLH